MHFIPQSVSPGGRSMRRFFRQLSGQWRAVSTARLCQSLALALLGAIPATGVQAATVSAGAVCFYEHVDYQGQVQCVNSGAANLNTAPWNDFVSSVKIQPGYQVELFEHYQFGGRALTLKTSAANLVNLNFNDTASSYRITTTTTNPAPTPIPVAVPAIPAAKTDAARLLIQATYGPTMIEIDRAASMGPAAWINDQLTTPSRDTHWDYVMVRKGPIGCTVCDAQYINATMESFWDQAVRSPDQLRQRTVLALSELFVVSTVNSAVEIQADAHASYLDMLARNAFGNFRTLLEQVSTHPTMGKYLSHLKNEKEDPTTGRIPDENYAREVMQLFTIGLWQLNPDGSRKKNSNGLDIPTFNQADVMGMAKVFTGWTFNNGDRSDTNWYWGKASYKEQMVNFPKFHSTSEKRFLGAVVPGSTSGEQSMKVAMDTLFNHPNVGPFIGSQLIKRFVTSNPSPAYVARVSAAFNNSNGVRGDMKSVLTAVLMDPEARDNAKANDAQWGKLREPLVRFGTWLRAFDAKSAKGNYTIWNLEDPVSSVGQNPLRAPSVFNWFRPG